MGCFMAAACSGYPQRVRHELAELIQKQIDSIEKETRGGATDAERWEYEQRRKRIDELHCELQRLTAAAAAKPARHGPRWNDIGVTAKPERDAWQRVKPSRASA
jgi:hypothetical protein